MPESKADAAYTLREAKALHEVGVTNHGWYMTEAEHRGVLDVLKRLEAALVRCAEVSGADMSDGAPTWPDVDVWAVQEVEQLRKDYDEAIS